MPVVAVDPADVLLQAASEADFESLLALRIAAMRPSLEALGRFDPERARERFRAGFSTPHTRHIVVGGRRVGFVALKPDQGILLLDHLYIHPDAQGRAIGGAVLALLFAEADEQGLPIRVGALRGSDSNRFYIRYGFLPIEKAEFDNYYLRPLPGTGGC